MTDYRNDTSQKERAEVLKNDRAVHKNTFLSHTHSEEGGRFARPQTIVGSRPTVDYPRLPSGPWADPVQVPPEEPLGYSVEDVPIVGEPHEIQASIEASCGDSEASACFSYASSPQQGDATLRPALDAPSQLASSAGAERSIVCDPSDDDVEPPAPASPSPKPTRGE
jgi:hypothetical protein